MAEDRDEVIEMFDQFFTVLYVWKVALVLFVVFTEFDKSDSVQIRYQILVFYYVCVWFVVIG